MSTTQTTVSHHLTPNHNLAIEVTVEGVGIVASAFLGPLGSRVDAYEFDSTRMWRSPITVRV